jgi:magnesium-transporting ATPase (P-type)
VLGDLIARTTVFARVSPEHKAVQAADKPAVA